MINRFASCFHDEWRLNTSSMRLRLVGQRVFGIALGYEDLNDHEELRHDAMMAILAVKLTTQRQDRAPGAGGRR
jgi:Transposase DDE domain group 1